MMMRMIAGVAAAALMMTAAGAASAQEEGGPAFSFNAGVTTDYVFRGVSQTDEDPQVFGGVDFTNGIFYAGGWASNVDFGNDTDAEIDGYLGIRPEVGGFTLDVGAIYYGYVNSPSGSDQDYWEFKAGASRPIGPVTVGAAAYWSPDFFGGTGDALYVEGNAAYAWNKFTFSGALGHQDVDYDGDYTTWNVGATYALTSNLGLDVRYHDTSEHDFGELFDSRVVAGLKATF